MSLKYVDHFPKCNIVTVSVSVAIIETLLSNRQTLALFIKKQ